MYFRDNQRRHLPHIHLRYQGEEVAISLEDGRLLEGTLPPGQLRMIQVWIDLHQEELKLNWDLAVDGVELFRIAPLQ